MRTTFNRLLAASLMTLALAACKDSSVNATPSGAGSSEAGASGGSAAAPGSNHGNTGPASDSPAATALGAIDAGGTQSDAGTATATGAHPHASDRPVTPPPDGKTNTKR